MIDGVNGDFEGVTCHAEESIYDVIRADGEVKGYTKFTLDPVLVHVAGDIFGREGGVQIARYIHRVALVLSDISE
jgi:hypothetical protein